MGGAQTCSWSPHAWHLLEVTENLDWVMAQWLACVLQEHEDLGSDSQHPMKSGHGGVHLES